MAVADRCPNCGSELSPNAPKGLCPRCLLQQGLESDAPSLALGGTPATTLSMTAPRDGSSVLAGPAASVRSVPHVRLRDTDPGTEPGPDVHPGTPEMPVLAAHSDRLQLLGEIARGGMGAVLRGRDGDIGRDLAVKVLLDKHRDNPHLIRRFIEEAQIAGQLQHPGIVPIYKLGTFADRRPYFTMKLVKGRTLADLLDARADPAADLPQLLGIFLQVCQTAAYAHARGVIHRDLKPSNIMVGSFGEVQVMDWGLAKVLARGGASDNAGPHDLDERATIIATTRSGTDSDRSQAGSVMGTPAYMAPEQARGEIDRVDERADVFALGSILCEVITGRPAFTGRDASDIHHKAERGDLADAFARLGTCGADAELLDLARDALAGDPEDRPRDAGEVASRLSSYSAGVQERLRTAELARAAEAARAEEARRTAEVAELARAAEAARAEEAQARAAVERSRRRRTAALAASLLAMMTLGGLTFTYISHERQARAAALERRLGRAETLLGQAHDQPDDPVRWRTARAAVQQVEDDPAGIAPAARDRLTRLTDDAESGLRAAVRDQTLRQALADIRANQQDAGPEATDAAYARAFRAAGLDVDSLAVTRAADRIKRRPPRVVVELTAYLDHWSQVRREARRPPSSWRKPLELAIAADDDPYRDRLRFLLAGDDRTAAAAKLRALAGEPSAAELPAPTAVLLGGALETSGDREAAVDLLRQAVVRHPDDVWVNFSLADTLVRLRPARREEAVRYYTAARGLRPETAHDLAHLLDQMGRGAEAVAIFRDLVARQPETARHLSCFGKCLKDHGRADEAGGVLDRAITTARTALKQNPEDAAGHNHLGLALFTQGKPAQAVAEYRAALELHPEFAAAHMNLGNALRDLGKPADAVAECRAALRLNPELAEAHNHLGNALRAQGKPIEAEAEYRAALRLDPEHAWAHNNLGLALADQGKWADAETELRRAIQLNPDFADARYNLGRFLWARGRPADAEATYREVLKRHPKYAAAHNNLGILLLAQGRLAEAEAAFREAIRLQPDLAAAYNNLGLDLAQQRRMAEAADAFLAVLKLRPDDLGAHNNLSLAFTELGKPAEAAAEFRAVLKLKPDHAKAQYGLGNALSALGDKAGAESAFRAAVRIKPDFADAYCNLGHLLRDTGRYAEAVKELRRGHELGSRQPGWSYPSARWVRDAERLAALDARLPAVLAGDDHPANIAERLTLAQIGSNRKLHAAAARLYAEALRATPELADDRRAQHPYNAACNAALAGCGRGKDDPPPDEAARARLRGQALGWLKGELAAWSRIIDRNQPEARSAVRQALEHWKVDTDLASLRDEAGLAKLDAEERSAWQSLWKDVETLLKKAQGDRS